MLEAFQVDLARNCPEHVPRGARFNPIRPERFPQPRDVAVERGRRGLGRSLTPQGFDQLVARGNAVGTQEQENEQSTLLRRAERDVHSVDGGLDRSEDPEGGVPATHDRRP